jgi:site-specific recombinase XerD
MAHRHQTLAALVESYFIDHLRRVRGASDHTVRAYRDSLRLFLLFLSTERDRPIPRLSLDDISVSTVLGFLDYIEQKRGNSVVTRNHRLAAIRGFVQHALRHDIERAAQYQRILAIPVKKPRVTKPITYLEPEEASVVIAQPDFRTPLGARDHALLVFLYNTGARVSEAIELRERQLHLRRPKQVRIFGKGGKERFCPLWSETTTALHRLLADSTGPEHLVFRNARGGALSRDGVAYIIAKHVDAAAQKMPELRRRLVSPHVFRHSCAVALLQAGVDVTVIRDYLGHASVATTSRYITTNLQTRQRALEAFWDRAGIERRSAKAWRPTPALLRFLDTL